MANYISRPVTELPSYMFTQFRVADGTQIYPGDIFLAETLDKELGTNNFLTFVPEEIDDVSSQIPAIVLNDNFERLIDGRRPKGQPDYTQYVFNAGEVVTAVRLLPEIKFEIGYSSISNLNDIDGVGYLIPQEGHSLLKFVKNISQVNTKVYFVVETLKFFRLGGNFGSEFANTLVARVKYNGSVQAYPDITAIQADVVQGLKVGDENVASGATVLTMNAVGGTTPITYTFIENGEAGADNDKFVIGSSVIKVGAEALTEAKTYKVYVQAEDSKGKTFKEGFDIPVAAE